MVDAGVLAGALGADTESGDKARARLRGEDLAAPAIIDLEVSSVWRKTLAGDDRRAAIALANLARIPLSRARHLPLLQRCWELRHSVTVYDAAYVALAEALDVTLVTTGGRLSRAPGIRCAIDVLL